jgi:hypothetical protein
LREGARLPRTISFICVMLSTSSLNSFLFKLCSYQFSFSLRRTFFSAADKSSFTPLR